MGEIYRTLTVEQKEVLEELVRGVRDHPLTVEQIELFVYFMAECSLGSMTKSPRSRKYSRKHKRRV